MKQFVQRHRQHWKQLEELTLTMERSRKNISSHHIDDFQQLYQKTAQHLSYSQTYFPQSEVTSYLNSIVAKAHNLLYKDQVSSFKQIRHFLSTHFVKLLIEQWKFVVVAMILFILGGVAGFVSVINDSLHVYSVLPAEIAQGVDPDMLNENEMAINPSLFSAEIMTNNIQVAILSFAGGILFGLLTVYLMIYNGLIIGGLAGLYWHYGKSYEFWAYILPHGMIELTAIFIAGGAGLLMGYKLFVPGAYSRAYQLKRQAKHSVQLFLGTIPLFIIAGIIEGYITPASFSLETKYIVAIITVIGLVCYVLIGYYLLTRKNSKATLHS